MGFVGHKHSEETKQKNLMVDRSILNQESPMKQAYDNFDIDNIGLKPDEYKAMAMKVPINQTTQLLWTDWRRRAFHQNVVFSATGISGSGKSSFLSSACLRLGKIYKEVNGYKYEPFTIQNVYYEPEDMKERLKYLKEGEILLKDEHLHGQAGMMSDLVGNVLVDAEQQLRKKKNSFAFASIEEEDHCTFFNFELKHILNDQNGYPKFVVAMLKTPLYSDPNIFVWRGLVAMPFPNKDFWAAYEKRKDEHIKKLKSQYGNTLTPVGIDAIKILKKRHEDLVIKTREGLMRPVKDELMDVIVSEEIGTRKYTNKGYSILKTQVRDSILKEFSKQNEAKMVEIADAKEKVRADKKEILMLQMEEAKKIKEAKLEAFKLKLTEDKRRNDLKQKALEIREKELEKAKETKEIKAENRAKNVEQKKEKLEGPAKHFADDFI